MKRRISVVQTAVSTAIDIFEKEILRKYTPNISIEPTIYNQIMYKNYNLFEECLQKLYIILNEWKGVSLNHTKQKLDTFRAYFTVGRSWFDQKKKKTLGTHLWIVVLKSVSNLADQMSKYFAKELQSQVRRAILFRVCLCIFVFCRVEKSFFSENIIPDLLRNIQSKMDESVIASTRSIIE